MSEMKQNLATKTVLFHFRRGSVHKTLKHFKILYNDFILTWNHGLISGAPYKYASFYFLHV